MGSDLKFLCILIERLKIHELKAYKPSFQQIFCRKIILLHTIIHEKITELEIKNYFIFKK